MPKKNLSSFIDIKAMLDKLFSLRSVGGNDAEAIEYYLRTADRGDARAQFVLGLMYTAGRGVAKDEVEAVRWYRKAADQGYAGAQCSLGVMHEQGCGVAKDEVEAVRWCRKAADQGYAVARMVLARIASPVNRRVPFPSAQVSQPSGTTVQIAQALAPAESTLPERYNKLKGKCRNLKEKNAALEQRLAHVEGENKGLKMSVSLLTKRNLPEQTREDSQTSKDAMQAGPSKRPRLGNG